MSWQATAWAQNQKTGSPAKKALLLVFANYADEHGVCWPAQKTAATATEQSVDSVQRQVKQLQAAGILRTACRFPRKSGKWPSFLYVLTMTEPQPAARSKSPRPGRTKPDDRAAPSPTTGPQALRHKPSLELPMKPPPPPNPPAPSATDEGGLIEEGLPPASEITFDEFWKAIRHDPGRSGPALAAWRKLNRDDRKAISDLIGPKGIDLDDMWASVWLAQRRWDCAPLNSSRSKWLEAQDELRAAPVFRELKPFSDEWTAERARKLAAGERTALMDTWASDGRSWSVRQ
jgi:hypothetical protein